jgi:hypothetical protein
VPDTVEEVWFEVITAVGWGVAASPVSAASAQVAAIGDGIGISLASNVGDIIIDGDDIFGDGVNIAARLEALCDPGGLCISRAANDQIRDKLSLAFADMGEQAVENISRAVGVFGLAAKDIEALPEAEFVQPVALEANNQDHKPPPRYEQEIHFCTTKGGRQLAYSRMGSGPPLVKTGNW